MSAIPVLPAPWGLQAEGYLLVYRFSQAFLAVHGFLPGGLLTRFLGGPGFVLLLHYSSSTAGPYDELLFIPGRFDWAGVPFYTVSRILVSTEVSAANGRRNWGLPKEVASFEHSSLARGGERVLVQTRAEPVLEMSARPLGPALPVGTSLFPVRLMQMGENEVRLVELFGSGRARLARVKELRVNPSLFPDVLQTRPLAALHLSRFQVAFPAAEVYTPES
ncbi:MAG: acetoacetate decarboxylase family protein [Anaerolineaceae bacterium]|nr:acetoacetate decarboxylase family protein [Anaerolineaceae bacterium]